MDSDFEKSPEFNRVKEEIKDNLEQGRRDGFNRADTVENNNETGKIIHDELGLEGEELANAKAEALAYVAEETIKDAREITGISTKEDALNATRAVLVENDEEGEKLNDNPVEKMVNDGYGAEVEEARKSMEQGSEGAEIDDKTYDKLVPELHIKNSEDAKLNQLVGAVYQNMEASDIDEATKLEIREALKKFVGETRVEKIFSEHKANYLPKTHVHNWITSMNQDLAKS
ncbi:MAG: hypothetical protein LBE03_00815, partial [Candidatus Nomurabacteria bacterium]|nr:hypothetical protein [Candidatus Nomurabacteria bacterium]